MNSQAWQSQHDVAVLSEQNVSSVPEGDQQILRIRRIGKRLFGVANCMVTFGDASFPFVENARSMNPSRGCFPQCSAAGALDGRAGYSYR